MADHSGLGNNITTGKREKLNERTCSDEQRGTAAPGVARSGLRTTMLLEKHTHTHMRGPQSRGHVLRSSGRAARRRVHGHGGHPLLLWDDGGRAGVARCIVVFC